MTNILRLSPLHKSEASSVTTSLDKSITMWRNLGGRRWSEVINRLHQPKPYSNGTSYLLLLPVHLSRVDWNLENDILMIRRLEMINSNSHSTQNHVQQLPRNFSPHRRPRLHEMTLIIMQLNPNTSDLVESNEAATGSTFVWRAKRKDN